MRFSNVAYTISNLWLILSVSFLLPLGFSIYEKDGLFLLFILQTVGMVLVSLIVRFFARAPTELTIREGFLTVSISWITLSLFGSIPFVASGFIPDFTDAFFETVSGFTTTGATILEDIETLPKSLLVWRNMTQWLGGMGVIALAVAILPFLGAGGLQLFKAEVPGPIKEKISSRISETAKILWGVYLILTVAETILLMLGGLSFFESLCTTFGTLATGGFCPRNASIAVYASPYVHYTIIFFMFIAGVNFSLHYWGLRGRFKPYSANSEFRFFTGVTLLAFVLIMAIRFFQGETPGEDLLRSSLFQTVSIITTTGFVTQDYEKWPLVARLILLALMFIGGCTSSTGGGIKNVRIQVLLRFLGTEVRKIFQHHGVFPVKIGGKPVSENVVSNIIAFIALYLLIASLGVLFMAGLGLDLDTSLGAVAATLGNVGPGIGTVGAIENYSHIPTIGKWGLSILMLIGRLEIFTVLVIFTGHFWRR